MLLILKLRSFLFLFFVGDHGKLFLKISQMQVVCIVTTFIYFSENRVARNTILIQRDRPVDWQDLMMVLAVQ